MSQELYKENRPRKFEEVIGQKTAVSQLVSMGKQKKIPHVLLFTGPSGVGKTTLARILASKMKCTGTDFYEINGASNRGIDDIRSIQKNVGTSPLQSPCRIWLLDEAHALTGDAQTALLKTLEDTPDHAYFFLATTDPQKLKKTIRTRCTDIRCKPLSEKDLITVVTEVAERVGDSVESSVASKIAEHSDGSARAAVQLLGKVLNISGESDRLDMVESDESRGEAFDLARAVCQKNPSWKKVSEAIKACDGADPETCRRIILGYASSMLLKSGNSRGSEVIDIFQFNFYDSGKAGLVRACWVACGNA